MLNSQNIYSSRKIETACRRDINFMWLLAGQKAPDHSTIARFRTGLDATFMHMKDDHMRNAQLKPEYNMQIGVDSEYIVAADIFQDWNDVWTLVPFFEDNGGAAGIPISKCNSGFGL